MGRAGGHLSVLPILVQPHASPAIGAASFLGVIVTVGVCASIALDRYGLIGFPEPLARPGGSPDDRGPGLVAVF